METIKVKVERILFPKTDDPVKGMQFCIIKTNLGVVKGQLSWRPEVDERVALVGAWKTSKFNGGLEFVFTDGRHDIPVDERSMLSYACELTAGIGPVAEKHIWEKLGDGWRDLSEADGIPRLTTRAIKALHETIGKLALQKEKMNAIGFLMSRGATSRLAEAAWSEWGESTISRVERDCYVLADLKGFSFKDVDSRLREAYGIGIDDPRRIRAAVIYFMKQLSQSSTMVYWRALNAAIRNAIDVSPAIVCQSIKEMFCEGRLVPFNEIQGIAMDKDYSDEKEIWDYVSGVTK